MLRGADSVLIMTDMFLQKLMGMASAQGNIVASLGQPVHMVRRRRCTAHIAHQTTEQ